MARPSPNRPAATCRPDSSDPAAAFAGLLAAHDDGQAHGTPLLTAAGVPHVRRLVLAARAGQPSARLVDAPAALPHWDAGGRRLWLGGRLLKEFWNEWISFGPRTRQEVTFPRAGRHDRSP